jgi:chemotaxis regulatin CheY-phosphate phosphatase CheZ
MTAVRRLSRTEYAAFEAAIEAQPMGRAFLRQRDTRERVVAVGQVRRLLQDMALATRPQDEPPSDADHVRTLRKELQEISVFIQQTRQEIAALSPDDKGNSRIVLATSELDAIVSATERATSDILGGTERIQEAMDRLPKNDDTAGIVAEIGNHIIEIMTACSFQDITGQRTARVVNAIRYIEQRINTMMDIWGVDATVERPVDTPQDTRPDAHLLNGPAIEGGVSQGDVDSLFGAGCAMAVAVSQDAINELFPD